ncbi:MAG: CBS domain-containing protein [Thaumarchaeota archaeon]|nr:CBS domain-containing protein [Nitrososphaerota archaeon]
MASYLSIATMRDVVFFLLYDRSDRNMTQIPISEVAVPVVSIDETASIRECAGMMLENGFGSLGVLSSNKISGIVTKTDLVKYFATHHVGRKSVGEYMSPYYFWLYDDASIYDMIRKLYEENITRLILRTQSEIPAGIITLTDLVRLTIADPTKGQVEFTEESFRTIFPKKFDPKQISDIPNKKLARDIMSKKIITVRYDEDLAKTCKIILDNKINGVGVISGAGNIIGILSKTDVIKALSYIQ